MSNDSRSVALTGLEAGTEYHVRMRVKYTGARYHNWQFANAEGDHTTNRPPALTTEFIANGLVFRGAPWE